MLMFPVCLAQAVTNPKFCRSQGGSYGAHQGEYQVVQSSGGQQEDQDGEEQGPDEQLRGKDRRAWHHKIQTREATPSLPTHILNCS